MRNPAYSAELYLSGPYVPGCRPGATRVDISAYRAGMPRFDGSTVRRPSEALGSKSGADSPDFGSILGEPREDGGR